MQICKTQLKKTDPYWRRVTYRIMTPSHFEALCSYAAGVYTVQLADMPFVYFSFYFPVDSNLWVLWSLIWIYELDFSFVFLQFKHTEKKARVDFSDRDSRTPGWWHILTQHDTPCKPEDVWFSTTGVCRARIWKISVSVDSFLKVMQSIND